MDWEKTQISLDLIISDVGGFIDQRQQKKSFLKESAVLTEAFSLAVGAKIWIQIWNLMSGSSHI